MRIHSLELRNFRSFYGAQEISFATDDVKNTTFIWADNAVGKTNLLNAITWCLYEEFTPNFKRREDLLNHQAATDGIKNFQVSVTFEEAGNTYTATRTGGSERVFRLLQRDRYGDHRQLPNPNSVINSILPKDMMKYFFIDGEGAPIAVSTSGEISAENSIKDILGFKVAEHALKDLLQIKREHIRELNKLDSSEELKQVSRQLESLVRDKQKFEEINKTLRASLYETQRELQEIDSYLAQSNNEVVNSLVSQRNSLERDIKTHERNLVSTLNEKRDIVRHYAWSAFAANLSEEAIDFIDESQFRGTIPAPYNETLIKDIIDEAECICGADVTPGSEALENIKKLLQKAANPIIFSRIQKARSFLQVAVDNSKKAPQEIRRIYTRVSEEEQKLNSKRKELGEISEKISAINVEDIQRAESSRSRLAGELSTTNRRLGRNDQALKSIIEGIPKHEARLSSLSLNKPKLQNIQQRITFIDEIIDTIKNSLDKALQDIGPLLAGEMSEFISASLPNNIKVGITTDFKVGLYASDDSTRRLVAPSGGLTAILTLIYTSTLVQIAKFRANAQGNILTPGAIAPLVLDAPFSHIGDTYTAGLAEALAEKSEQLIIFMFDKSAKGGEELIRNKGKCGKEYYLRQETTEPLGDKAVNTITVLGETYPVTRFGCDKNNVQIVEIY